MGYWRLYYHIVWATQDRAPIISENIEPSVHRLIGAEATRQKGMVYAINGMADHIHLVVAVPPTHDLSTFIKQVKGSTSRFIQDKYKFPFYWQAGYGIFSVGPQGMKWVIDYVQGQKAHHTSDDLTDVLEIESPDNIGPTLIPLFFPDES